TRDPEPDTRRQNCGLRCCEYSVIARINSGEFRSVRRLFLRNCLKSERYRVVVIQAALARRGKSAALYLQNPRNPRLISMEPANLKRPSRIVSFEQVDARNSATRRGKASADRSKSRLSA